MLAELALAQIILGQREHKNAAHQRHVDHLIARYGDLDAVPREAGIVDRVVVFARGLRPQSRVATAALDGSPAAA